MVLSSSLIRNPICGGCRTWLLRSIVAVTGLEIARAAEIQYGHREYHDHRAASSILRSRHRQLISIANGPQRQGRSSRRRMTSSTESSILAKEDNVEAESSSLLPEDNLDTTAAQSETQTSSTAYVPWYLQHQATTPKSIQHTAAGQEPPELPEHSPDLLQPIVTHVLETLGLTHLRVLDLRNMTDPPPALGANLLMVIATARSERHLHASADKLCRWLRTEYRLSPFADGLLGRNEMKIAVRRRARRAKMMSAVGAKSADDGDLADGLRSDWICVNVGRVEGGILPATEATADLPEIIGFGTSNTSSALVVQMMTEGKREEIDLEGLWLEALRRQNRKKQALRDAAMQATETSSNGMDGDALTTTTASTYATT